MSARALPRRTALLAAAACLLSPTLALAHGYKFGALQIGHVWAPPADKAAEGVPVYGPIFNTGDKAARLVGATSPAADAVRIRVHKDGATSWPDGIDLPSGKPVAMAAWRAHLWLTGLHKALKEGDSFDVTLDFGPLGQKTISVVVQKTPGE